MSKRYNKQNRGSKLPQNKQSNNMMSERKKKIYAYILAGFIIFWNIASVLGIIGFVRSFAKAEECSDDTVQAVSTRTMSVDMSTPVTVNDEEEFSDEGQFVFPLGISGATSHYYGSRDVWFCGSEFFVCIPDTGEDVYVKGFGSSYRELVSYDDEVAFDVALTSVRVTPQNVLSYYSILDEVYIWYENIDGLDFSWLYPFACDVYCTIEEHGSDDDFFVTYTYLFEIKWYDGSTFLNDTSSLYVSFSDGFDYSSSYPLMYPSLDYANTSAVPDTEYYIGSFDLRGYTALEYDSAISQGYDQGFDIGYDQGYDDGYEEGYDEGNLEGYNRGFNEGEYAGYEEGYDEGWSLGWDEGYEYGYLEGVDQGYDDGYYEGAANASDYSFMALISAVIDAPIKAITGLFNFEILGVNLSAFFFGLLSVAVIICVVKLFI